jgi:hypothetical protein
MIARMCKFLSQVLKLHMLEMTVATTFRQFQLWEMTAGPMTGLSLTLQWDSKTVHWIRDSYNESQK